MVDVLSPTKACIARDRVHALLQVVGRGLALEVRVRVRPESEQVLLAGHNFPLSSAVLALQQKDVLRADRGV